MPHQAKSLAHRKRKLSESPRRHNPYGVKHQPEAKALVGSQAPKVQRRKFESSPKDKENIITIMGETKSPSMRSPPHGNSFWYDDTFDATKFTCARLQFSKDFSLD